MRALLLRCPYCMAGFDPQEAITCCNRCSTAHHQTCWNDNGHCSVFACNGQRFHSGVPRWMEIAPPLLLALLILDPVRLMPIHFLWFPAFVCCVSTTFRLFNAGRLTALRHKLIFFILNTASVTASVIQIVKL